MRPALALLPACFKTASCADDPHGADMPPQHCNALDLNIADAATCDPASQATYDSRAVM